MPSEKKRLSPDLCEVVLNNPCNFWLFQKLKEKQVAIGVHAQAYDKSESAPTGTIMITNKVELPPPDFSVIFYAEIYKLNI